MNTQYIYVILHSSFGNFFCAHNTYQIWCNYILYMFKYNSHKNCYETVKKHHLLYYAQ